MLFAHRTVLLKWDGEQSAVNPIRKCTWTIGKHTNVSPTIVKRKMGAVVFK